MMIPQSSTRLHAFHGACVVFVLWVCLVYDGPHRRPQAAAPSSPPREGHLEGDLSFGTVQVVAHGVPAFSNGGCHMIAEEYSGLVWKHSRQRSSGGSRASHLRNTASAVLTSWPPSAHHPECIEAPHASTSDGIGQRDEDQTCHSVYTGMRWQCVEYARRFLIAVFGVSFGDVVGAEDIWHNVDCFSRVLPPPVAQMGAGTAMVACDAPVQKFNACAPHTTAIDAAAPLPKIAVGDLIIWHRQVDMPYGHVAVVVGPPQPKRRCSTDGADGISGCADARDKGEGEAVPYEVPIAEQNFAATPWATGTNHSRMLDLVLSRAPCDADGAAVDSDSARHDAVPLWVWRLVDPFGYTIVGWMQHSPSSGEDGATGEHARLAT